MHLTPLAVGIIQVVLLALPLSIAQNATTVAFIRTKNAASPLQTVAMFSQTHLPHTNTQTAPTSTTLLMSQQAGQTGVGEEETEDPIEISQPKANKLIWIIPVAVCAFVLIVGAVAVVMRYSLR